MARMEQTCIFANAPVAKVASQDSSSDVPIRTLNAWLNSFTCHRLAMCEKARWRTTNNKVDPSSD